MSASSPAPPVSSKLGYQEIQTTKPQTIGQLLSDSPASWVIDKWHAWSDHDGNVQQLYTKDQLLTNIMIYWVTNSWIRPMGGFLR